MDLKRFSVFFLIFLLNLICQIKSYAISIDGINDFTDDDRILTTTAGYTNWISWDSNTLYIGYYGEDIDTNVATTMLLVYFSTNTNTGSAYGETFNGQQPVLPFRADYIFQYITTNSWNSGFWNGYSWEWNNPLKIAAGDLSVSGNYLEFQIFKSNMNDTPYLDIYIQFVNISQTYGAIPGDTLIDGFDSNPSNFLSFGTNIWITNLISSSNIYKTNDNIDIISNDLLLPLNYQTNTWGEEIVLSNYSEDDIGIYKVEFYTNSGVYSTIYASNYNNYFVSLLNTSNMIPATYNIYTIAYDTKNIKYSQTNILEVLSAPDLSVVKTVDSIQLGSTNLYLPGSLVIYKITYSNLGSGYATNVVICDKIPVNSTYNTNYLGAGTTGWEVQFAHIENPDQSYDSTDYDGDDSNVRWIRWRKASIAPDEDDKTIFLGVTID